MSNFVKVGVSWLSSWFNGSTFASPSSHEKQKLVAKGLIEESPKQIILHDRYAGKYIYFTGPDKEKKLADYLQTNLKIDSEEVLGQTDKVMMVALGAILAAGQLIVPIMFIAERLNVDRFHLPNIPCKTGVLTSSLCLASPKSKELCLWLSALSCLKPVFASITVIKTIPDQKAYPNQKFNLSLNISEIFHESDPSLSMSVVAKQSNGETLPAWLTFGITPSLLGSIATISAIGVYVVSNIAYVADTNNLKLIDVSNPRTPSLLGSIAGNAFYGVYVVPNIAYVASYDAGLRLIDVTDPHNPSFLGSITFNRACQVYVLSNIAFVVALDGGLKIIDVTNPHNPSLLGSIVTDWAEGIYVVSNIAYVADANGGLKIIDVSNPRAPSLLGSIVTNMGEGVYIVSNVAYVTEGNGGLKIIDVSNPRAPSLLGSIVTNMASGVYVDSNIAYVTDGNQGLKIIDVTDSHNPSFLGSIVTDEAMGVYVVSNVAYVADGNAGLKIIDTDITHCIVFFYGVPICTDRGKNYNITMQAKNSLDETASTVFNLAVYDAGPKVTCPIANQTVEIAKTFNFLVPNNVFYTICGDVLTYFSQLVGGSPLPSWLSFNPTNQQFSGTPLTKEDIKNWDIAVRATDPYGQSTQTNFYLDVFNKGIKVAGSLQNMQIVANVYFEYLFPNTLFIDEDNLPLSYRALLLNGEPLPSWLQIDSDSRTFYGTPVDQDVGKYPVRLYAGDHYDEKYVDFEIVVYSSHYQPPVVNKGIPGQKANVGSFFSYTILDNAFTSPNNDKLTYSAFLSGGKPLPSWLAFAPDIKTFSGSPKSEGVFSITVKVIDSYESSVQTSFSLTTVNQSLRMIKALVSIGGPIITAFGLLITAYTKKANIRNYLMKKKYQLPDQTIIIGEEFTHKIEKIAVKKIKQIKVLRLDKRTWKESALGEYVANWWNNHWEELPAEQLLPSWLKYCPASNELKATPSEMTIDDIGDYKVRVLDKSKYCSEEFVLHVTDHAAPNTAAGTTVELGDPLAPGDMHQPLLRETEE